MKSKFTLIELIVVIAVLGLLASIIVPNISNIQGKATTTSVAANLKTLQLSSDMYTLNNEGDFPSEIKPIIGFPQPIDYSKLSSEYTRNKPKTDGYYYWVDYRGEIWTSTSDSPTSVELSESTRKLTWDDEPNAKKYNVYEVQTQTTSAVAKQNLRLVATVTTNEYDGVAGKTYAVSSVDKNGFESAPAVKGYVGYPKTTNPTITEPKYPEYGGLYNNNLGGIGDFAENKNHIFLQKEGGLFKMGKDGANLSLLSTDTSRFINIMGDYIYYLKWDYTLNDSIGINKIKTDGTDAQQILNGTGLGTLTVTDKYIYFLKNGELHRMSLDGSNEIYIGSVSKLIPIENKLYATTTTGAVTNVNLVEYTEDGVLLNTIATGITNTNFIQVGNKIYYSIGANIYSYDTKTKVNEFAYSTGSSYNKMNYYNGMMYHINRASNVLGYNLETKETVTAGGINNIHVINGKILNGNRQYNPTTLVLEKTIY